MPFSSVLGASSVIRPGVCTSTTRPSVPYEGQLIYETDTDRVAAYNGSAWVYTHSSGLIVIKSKTDYTAASSFTVDNIFTSDFSNYLIRIASTGSAAVTAQLRVGGVAATTNYNTQAAEAVNATAWTVYKNTAQTNADIGSIGVTKGFLDLYVFGPQLAAQTGFFGNCVYGGTSSAPGTTLRWSNHSTATAYDGIAISFSGANTGSYIIYGFNQ